MRKQYGNPDSQTFYLFTDVYAATLAIMGRFCVNISYNIGLQYAAELLPTVVRAQGVALIHIMGYVASIVAPFVVYLAVISPALPLLILGILGIVGGGLSLFLPETLDKDLPQTLQDGEEFGKDQGIWDMPCLMKYALKFFSKHSKTNKFYINICFIICFSGKPLMQKFVEMQS